MQFVKIRIQIIETGRSIRGGSTGRGSGDFQTGHSPSSLRRHCSTVHSLSLMTKSFDDITCNIFQMYI